MEAKLPPETPKLEPEVYTVREVAALLQLAPKTVYGMVQANEIPGVLRVGRRGLLRFHRATVLAWLKGEQDLASRERQ